MPITGSFDGNIKILELRRNIVELEDILQAEKADFTVICLSIALLRNHCHTYAW
jgi:hypothetical protein